METDPAVLENNLLLFDQARRWKAYFRSRIGRYLRGHVLEVGAGIGANADALLAPGVESWLCLEPDRRLAERISQRLAVNALAQRCRVLVGTLASLRPACRFDAVVYLDVLEHIEDDRGELLRCVDQLAPGGHLVVLSPAYPSLYTEYDAQIGHHRRYTRDSLCAAAPRELITERVEYLDAIGALASLANRLLLRQGEMGARQLRLWDRAMIPVSRAVDPLLARRVGRSVLGVWRKPADAGPAE
jgi:SAM-dependent methyltransferase